MRKLFASLAGLIYIVGKEKGKASSSVFLLLLFLGFYVTNYRNAIFRMTRGIRGIVWGTFRGGDDGHW
jgi:hypothetical protein